MNVSGFFQSALQKLPKQPRTILLTCLYALGAALAAVAFHLAVNFVFETGFKNFAKLSTAGFLIASFCTIIIANLIVGWLLTSFSREAAGSGIPQLKLSFWQDFGCIPWRVVWVKFVAGVLSLGGGTSLGREGPSVQLGGGLASNLAGLAGEPKQNRRRAAAAGAAAALAAAFNTPLAAITFVLEEIIEDLNSRFLGSILLASVLGALVVHGLIGEQPAFSVPLVGEFSLLSYLLIPLVAALAALIGVGFQKAAIALRGWRKFHQRLPRALSQTFGAFITWVLGAGVFLWTGHLGVFGLGYDDLSTGLANQLDWRLAGLLLGAKLLATIACYGFGGCGGIFSPTLFFGGMCGLFLSGLFGLFLSLGAADHSLLCVVGMSACLGAVVGAPITGILIVFEMTHEFSLVPALMLGALISESVRRLFLRQNFYEALLHQDGHNVERLVPPRDLIDWQQLPVSTLANFSPVLIQEWNQQNVPELLKRHPYACFPVLRDGACAGVVTRAEALAASQTDREPALQAPVTCLPTQTIREAERLILNSTSGMLLLLDRPNGQVIAVLTLHDILRAQLSVAERKDI